jgi:hypothetical protein
VSLSQWGRVVPFFNSSAAANPTPFGAKGLPPADAALARAALSRGLVMVASLWASPGRTAEWLDGGCGGAARCELSSAALTLSNFSLRPHRPSAAAAAAAAAATAAAAANAPRPNALRRAARLSPRHNATRRGVRPYNVSHPRKRKEPRPPHEPEGGASQV